jgi:hypothetical protein
VHVVVDMMKLKRRNGKCSDDPVTRDRGIERQAVARHVVEQELNLNCSRHRSTARDDASDNFDGMLTLCLGSGEMGVKWLEGTGWI